MDRYTLKNKIKSNKGSTLVILLIIITIFIMLGTAILSVAVSNYKMKAAQSNAKKNFYFAESGLDEAYGKMGKVFDSAVEEGNKEVDIFMNTLSIKASEILTFMKENEEIPLDYQTYLIYLNEDGSFNMDMVIEAQNTKFQETFTNYIEGILFTQLQDVSSYNFYTHGEFKIVIQPIISFNVETERPMVFSIESTFTDENIEKKLAAKYEIKIPKYNIPYYTESSVLSVNRNVGWSKAIAAEGDLKSYEGSLRINGDVYVKGNGGTFGGISTMSDNTQIIVNGNISSMKNIQTASSDSVIQITGNVYADDFQVAGKDEYDNPIQRSMLTVNRDDEDLNNTGSVYTFDDLSLNGKSSEIYIENSYYGVSNGELSSKPDNSSSIIINTEDIGNGSTLTIDNEVIIAGTSYINVLYEGNKYQTGESVSVIGNYRAYSYQFISPSIPKFDKNNINFEYYDPLNLAYSFEDTGITLKVRDKSEYFKLYSDEKKDSLILGGDLGININPLKSINLGVLIHNDSVKPWEFPVDFDDIIEQPLNDYIRQVYYMGADDTIVVDGDLSINPQDERTVSYWVNFSNLPTPIDTPTLDLNREVILLDGSSKKYAVIGRNADDFMIPVDAERIELGSSADVKGIIMTQGDIHICGEIDFTGTIITNGSIYFSDTNTKNLTYDENYVALKVAENISVLENVFIDNYLTSVEITTNSRIGSREGVYTDIIRDKLIRLRNWSIVN